MFKRITILLIALLLFLGLIFTAGFYFIYSRYYVAPIVMYHSVIPAVPKAYRLAVSTKTFQRQMSFLKSHKYNIVPLETLAAMVRDKQKIPPKTIAITFDDGYKDNYTFAFPILKRYKIPATIFVITREIGRPDRLSWEEIKEMSDSGLVTIGSHATGPDPLIKIKSDKELKSQIFDSRRILTQKLGKMANVFSYPEGMFNEKIRNMVIACGYKAAVATSPGKKYPNDDVFALKRLRISENAGNLFVFWFETAGIYTFIKERRHK